jgi:glycine/D-amino acid oxidase-like deaminating enzyme
LAKRALVIGGGIIGLSAALRLCQAGLRATVIETAGAPKAASWGNAGHIATEQVEPLASWPMLRSAPRRLFSAGGALALPPRQIGHWLPFALRMIKASSPDHVVKGRAALRSLLSVALPAWRDLVAHLAAPGLLREDGHIVVWESAASAAAGLASWRAADTGTARFRECTKDELHSVGRVIKQPLTAGIRFENTGQIADLPKLANALRDSLTAQGVEIMSSTARDVEHGAGSATVTLASGERLSADLVLVAAGVRSAALLKRFCASIPLIAERGYHLQMPQHHWPDLPPVAFEDRSMIVTRFESGLRAASFVEFSAADAPPDSRKWQRLRAHVASLGLPGGPETIEWMGARPTLPDYLPAIGRFPSAPNILYAFGHQHLGLTLAAVTAELVAQLATDAAPTVDLNPFNIQRFSAETK